MSRRQDEQPAEIYSRELQARRAAVSRHRQAEKRFSLVRLALFVVGSALAWQVIFSQRLGWVWLAAPVVAFGAVAVLHERLVRRRVRAERAAAFHERGLARLEDRWAGHGNPGDGFLDREHPYAQDLDLFGEGSLFELLCAARTKSGERTLATYLLDPADAEEVLSRQEAVRELRDRLDLREDLAVLGEDVRADDDPDALTGWARAPSGLKARWPVAVAGGLAVANFLAFGAWMVLPGGGLWFLASLTASGLFAMVFHDRTAGILRRVERPQHELELLAGVLARLEVEPFHTDRLKRLRSRLETRGEPPSRRIAKLARLVQLRDSMHNMIFRPFAAMMLLGTQLAFAAERWREVSGEAVAGWLEAVGQIEALGSLAGAAFDRPDDPFPGIVQAGPRFEGRGLGHPLLPVSRCVRNDVRIDDQLGLLLVSGSNMSGKSTLLRTVGINAVLALAGGTVRAGSLTISPMNIGACMRVQDSLQEGVSHFYAEIRRLRSIVDLGRAGRPLLFLLDEVLHGTNSHDRRIGAEALILGLVARGGVGLVTTHDLALAEIAEALAPRAANVHFEDHLEDGKIAFDYVLKEGVVRKSNALDLMRAVGLQV